MAGGEQRDERFLMMITYELPTVALLSQRMMSFWGLREYPGIYALHVQLMIQMLWHIALPHKKVVNIAACWL